LGLSVLNWIAETGRLLLPVLVPSWRFFDEIAPSPRIEYCTSSSATLSDEMWQEFRPRPVYVSVPKMLRRIIWNPRWNESLYLMSCAERLMSHPTRHSADEIFDRLIADLSGDKYEQSYVQFRLVFLYRYEGKLYRQVTYLSDVRRVSGGDCGA